MNNLLGFIKNHNGSFNIHIHCCTNDWIDNIAVGTKYQLCIICQRNSCIIGATWKYKINLCDIYEDNTRYILDETMETSKKRRKQQQEAKPFTACPTFTRSSISCTSLHPPFWIDGWPLTLCTFLFNYRFLISVTFMKNEIKYINNRNHVRLSKYSLEFWTSYCLIFQK